jgi:hypothetical protein
MSTVEGGPFINYNKRQNRAKRPMNDKQLDFIIKNVVNSIKSMKEGDILLAHHEGSPVSYLEMKDGKVVADSGEEVTYDEKGIPQLSGMKITEVVSMEGGARRSHRRRHRSRKAHRKSRRSTRRHR